MNVKEIRDKSNEELNKEMTSLKEEPSSRISFTAAFLNC